MIKTLCPIFSGWRGAWIKGMSSWIFSLPLCLTEKKTQLFRVDKFCEKRGQKDTLFKWQYFYCTYIHKLLAKEGFTVGCTVHVSLCDLNPLS